MQLFIDGPPLMMQAGSLFVGSQPGFELLPGLLVAALPALSQLF
jgi:hypothetical protein